jgi:hypothetical protein
MTSADLIDELRPAGNIAQSAQGLVAQCGSLQYVEVGYAALDSVVGQSAVTGKRSAAQLGDGSRGYKVTYRLCLETLCRGTAAPLFYGR